MSTALVIWIGVGALLMGLLLRLAWKRAYRQGYAVGFNRAYALRDEREEQAHIDALAG